jgi:hypothetical protein
MSLHFLATAWHAVQHVASHIAHLLASKNGMEWD